MGLVGIPLPATGYSEYVSQSAVNGPIVPGVVTLDMNNNLMFQSGTEGWVHAGDGQLVSVGAQGDTPWNGQSSSAASLIAVNKYGAQQAAAAAASLAGTIKTTPQSSSALFSGGPTAAPSAGGAMAAQTCSWVTITNDLTSNGVLYVGSSAGQATPLQPGQSATITVTNTNLVYLKGAAGVYYDWVAGS